jgi:hypothetical protein
MKHILFSALLLFTLSSTAFAQNGNGEKIKALRISYLTERLHLSSDQAARFWPVYNQYDDERRALRRSIRQNIQSQNPNLSKEKSRQIIEADLQYRTQDLELKKKYKDRLLQVISPQQLATLYQAEQDFKKILLEKLRDMD